MPSDIRATRRYEARPTMVQRHLTAREVGELVSNDEPPQTILQADGVEIQQQSNANLAHSEIGQHLRIMSRKQHGDGFYFQQNSARNHEVGSESERKGLAFIDHRERDLPLEGDAGLFQFFSQAFAIDGFKKAGPDSTMHLDRQTDDNLRQISMFQNVQPPCLFVVLRVLRGKAYERMNGHPLLMIGLVARPHIASVLHRNARAL